jgi:lysophospholipase L1-like esterase
MPVLCKSPVFIAFAVCWGLLYAHTANAETTIWKTAFFKRGFIGNFSSDYGIGLNSSVLSRTPLAYGGTYAKVSVTGCWYEQTHLAAMSLIRGADNVGHTQGGEFAVTFAGSQALSLTPLQTAVSDAIALPLIQGLWYLKDSYTAAVGPAYFPYAYDVDTEYVAGSLRPIGYRTGITNRIDVLTSDSRKSLICYGDSITAGYNSTPNAGQRYPEILAALTNRPVLNLGVNGDLFVQADGSSDLIGSLAGVGGVAYLMGINDLIGGQITTLTTYANIAEKLIAQNHAAGRVVYWGTLMPATGYLGFDATKETLRQDINTWIRTLSGADGVIDFDLALRDPGNTGKLSPAYQSDWLHPNDAGYQKMAETAAAIVSNYATWAIDNDLLGDAATTFAPTLSTGGSYSATLTASGSPAPTFSVQSGTLPAGLTLNAITGVLSGTPTTAGTFTGVFAATNSQGTVTQAFTFTVAAPVAVPALPPAVTSGPGWRSAR